MSANPPNVPGAQGYGYGAPQKKGGGGMKTALLIGCVALACVMIPIVGVLAMIAIPNFMKFSCKAKQSEAKTHLAGLYTAEKAFYGEYNFYTSDLKALNWAPDGSPVYLVGFAYAGPEDLRESETVPSDHDIDRADSSNAEILARGGYTTVRMKTSDGGALTSSDLPEDTWVERDRFIAGAVGDIDNDGTLDIWTIDETKRISNVTDDCGE